MNDSQSARLDLGFIDMTPQINDSPEQYKDSKRYTTIGRALRSERCVDKIMLWRNYDGSAFGDVRRYGNGRHSRFSRTALACPWDSFGETMISPRVELPTARYISRRNTKDESTTKRIGGFCRIIMLTTLRFFRESTLKSSVGTRVMAELAMMQIHHVWYIRSQRLPLLWWLPATALVV